MMLLKELNQISDHVWLFPQDDNANAQPNVGIIKTSKQTILVDGCNSPSHARQLMNILIDKDFPIIDIVIYTHHHWDHIFGTHTFRPRIIIGHMSTAALIRQKYTHLPNRDDQYRNPLADSRQGAMNRVMGDWRDFHLVMPTFNFSQRLFIHADDLTIEIKHVGGQHAEDSCVVTVLPDGVMFLGDCYYEPPISEQHYDVNYHWDVEMMESFIRPNIHTYISGHDVPMSATIFKEITDRLKSKSG
jgi:glyoxylase-like metal-dependent hydrolase (beta-lactamase superfamily II)